LANGKVEEVHKGKDDKFRVVKVKTKKPSFTRPVAKMCRLIGVKQAEDLMEKTVKIKKRVNYNMDAYFQIIKKSNVLIQKMRNVCGSFIASRINSIEFWTICKISKWI